MDPFVLALLIPAALAPPLQSEMSLDTAQDAFRKCRFEEAATAYQRILEREPERLEALAGLGHLRLLQNRLPEAEGLLKAVTERDPAHTLANRHLGDAYFRQDRFDLAAPFFRAAGKEGRAKQMEAFAGLQPYTFETAPDRSEVPFEITDPLPVVKLEVNGREAEFLVDTGGADLSVDPEFAAQCGMTVHGEEIGTFAGGRARGVPLGKVDQVKIGEYRIRHLPISTIPMGPIAGAFGRPLKGVVGTSFLSHFLFTLDYPAGRLVLQRRTQTQSEILAAETRAQSGHELPLWLAGLHMMMSRGQVNDSPEVMLFLDTGLAGAGGVMVSPALAKEAGIEPPVESLEGIGGGGAVAVKPIVAREVRLGAALERDVRGVYGGLHTDEYRNGFRLAGIVSHSFLRPYRVSFDLLGMRLHLIKPPAVTAPVNP